MDLTSFGVKKEKKKLFNQVNDEKLDFDFDNIKTDYKQEEYERYLPWFIKYKLKNYENLIITPEIKKIIDFLKNFKKGKAILLHGPAGCGKTTTTTLIANHFNYELFEINASDTRNKKSINELIGGVLNQNSLFDREKLILIDEVDGVSGTQDRGGVAEIVKYIKKSRYPIIFTANDIESAKIKSLIKACYTIDFENHSFELLFELGKKILKEENIQYDQKDLKEFIQDRNISDIRGFINDLQVSVYKGKFELSNNLEIRNYKKKLDFVLNKIYFSYPEDALRSSYNTDINLDDLFLYLEENTPNVYDKKHLNLAFNEIGKADIFRGRIRKWQYWRYLVYINFYLTYGISTHKLNPKKTIYKRNQRILKKWIYTNKYNSLRSRTITEKKKEVPQRFIEKLAKHYKTSVKNCRQKDVFYFAYSYQKNKEFQKEMDKKFEIDFTTKKSLLEM
ncbi:MAG: AAA family ATPase [Nanoarchaeota archaeon]